MYGHCYAEAERQRRAEEMGCSSPEEYIKKRREEACEFIDQMVKYRFLLTPSQRAEVARQLTTMDRQKWTREAVVARLIRIAEITNTALKDWAPPKPEEIDLEEDLWGQIG